ncbi:MAG: holo-ACP synthase [Syntrophales bacterium LBB04]|nr:holo-ACP synthase [Syntrophales bacterium LBB04]
MIYGTGIDIVEVRRMEEITKKWGNRFVARVFSPGEIDYCSNHAMPAMHYAARFAAKESFLKSLGLGLGMGIGLRDIEVSTDCTGKPKVMLHGGASEILHKLGIGAVHVSLSHTRQMAAAMVVLEK